MTLKRRVEQLEQQIGHSEETFELLGMTMTRAELDELLRELNGTTTQACIDPTDNAP